MIPPLKQHKPQIREIFEEYHHLSCYHSQVNQPAIFAISNIFLISAENANVESSIDAIYTVTSYAVRIQKPFIDMKM